MEFELRCRRTTLFERLCNQLGLYRIYPSFGKGVANSFGLEGILANRLDPSKEVSLIPCTTTPRSDRVVLLVEVVLILLERLAIERLQEMRCMRRKAEGNNLLFIAKIEEFVGKVGSVTVEKKKPVRAI
jgi:hypothetical protein